MTSTSTSSTARDLALLGARVVLGGYLAAHGSQKLFGALDGPGLDAAGAGFESMGLTPGKPMAALAAGSELVGGLATIAGVADPIGPFAIVGTMAVASVVHGPQGPLAAKGGYELALTNLALGGALLATGPGRFRLTPALPASLAKTAAVVGGGLTALSIAKILGARKAKAAEAAAAPIEPATDEAAA
ncbi:DoxX family protein [Aquihabitans sp. G128]|uniref:DoxX family protein n=1 Tax=Aquihabitans sp. G128 TaxID=2849779 RepID=UPI001C245DC6|nr:DoxX family protein [Aquihabitans sp. G128]QXC60920.1 DoxX family protein [Aquihabitans sp. G128]